MRFLREKQQEKENAEGMENEFYHDPVLLKESVSELIGDRSSGVFVDTTFGGGGHSVQILKSINSDAHLFAFDQDRDALSNNIDDGRLTLIQSNFRYLSNFLDYYGVGQVDGILADLGVSSYQFDKEERGFSIRGNAELDMRMNESSKSLRASDVLNAYSQAQLQKLFTEYGGVKFARSLSVRIVEQRKRSPFVRSQDLIACIMDVSKQKAKVKELAQVFQALRIEVNDEVGALQDFLLSSAKSINLGGRLVVISYHSLEDRLVKRFLHNGNFTSIPEKDDFGNILRAFDPKTKKPIVPDEEEIKLNSRSRSAKMRIGIKR